MQVSRQSSAQRFEVLTLSRDGGCDLVLRGELDLAGIAVLEAAVAEIVDGRRGSGPVDVDTSGVSFIDVVGLRSLADACAELAASERLHAVRLGETVTRVIAVCGISVPGSPSPSCS